MNRIQIDSTRSKSKITVPGKRTTTKTTNAISEESAIDLEVQIRCRALLTLLAARRLEINSWRWKGVPFYIRAGKSLPVTATEVIVRLRQPPAVFMEVPLPANYFRFRVTPDLMIAAGALVKKAGEQLEGQPVELVISQQSDPAEMGAYEELLHDAVQGNSGRFARQDYVEEAWRIVDPILDNATPVYEYDPGTWGPPRANVLIAPDGEWFDPTL